MKIPKLPFYGVVFTCLALFLSCVDDTDFDQAENILATPVLESSLIFSNLSSSNFINDDTQLEVTELIDTTRLEYINSDFFVDQLLKTNLTFRFTNGLDRGFNVSFEFVTDDNELRYQAQVEVPPGQPDNLVLVESNFLIEEPELSTFEEATKLIYRITLPPTTSPIDIDTPGILKLESKATFYFEL